MTSSFEASSSPLPAATAIDDQLMKEVRNLILQNCRDTSPSFPDSSPFGGNRNHTGVDTSDDARSIRRKQRGGVPSVHFRESANKEVSDLELLQIPIGLGALFFAAQAERHHRPSPNLTRLVLIAAAPPPPEDPCHRLYAKHQERETRRQQRMNEIRDQLLAEETKPCTFKPELSEVAKQLPSKGTEHFLEKCLDWKRSATSKLQKKAEREKLDKEEEDMKPWKMNARSRKLVERRERLLQKEVEAASPEQGGDEIDTETSNKRCRRSASPASPASKFHRNTISPETYSFEPVTNTATRRELYLTGAPSPKHSVVPGDGDAGSDDDGSSPGDDTGRPAPARTTASQFVQRLQDDIKARELRATERRKKYEALQKERLYDNETGQPLFQPNAVPTKLVGQKRVPFTELSPEERAELQSKLAKQGMRHITRPALLQRSHEQKRPWRTVSNSITKSIASV